MKTYFFLTAFILFFSSFIHTSLKNDWIVLATKSISFSEDTDHIKISKNDRFVDKIKIKCIQGTFKLRKIRVEMSDGQTKEYDARGAGVLTNGMTTMPFDLPGRKNKLIKISLDYESFGKVLITNRAKAEILGRTY